MKMTHGSWSRAYPNISRTTRALSPMYLSTIAEETTLRKLVWSVAATARAKRVFPVPGGPYSRTPFGGLMPTRTNSSGFKSGNSMIWKTWISGLVVYVLVLGHTSRSSLTCSPNPPIPAKEAPPGSSKLILYTIGSTSRGRIRIIVNVVISSETRVPVFSFATGSVGRYDTT